MCRISAKENVFEMRAETQLRMQTDIRLAFYFRPKTSANSFLSFPAQLRVQVFIEPEKKRWAFHTVKEYLLDSSSSSCFFLDPENCFTRTVVENVQWLPRFARLCGKRAIPPRMSSIKLSLPLIPRFVVMLYNPVKSNSPYFSYI